MKIEFKAKSYTNALGEETIKIPEITRSHCDMIGFRNSKKFGGLANSDMFLLLIKREMRILGIEKYLRLERLPQNVSIEKGFLNTVTIKFTDQV